MSFFSVNHLTAGYGGKSIINDISFSAESGRLLGILGANGSGKTTLLKSICGILPHSGSCILDGDVLEMLSARQIAKLCSYIPQRSGISIDISAEDVVLMGFNPDLGLLESPSTTMQNKARDMLKSVGLEGKEETNYLHLSEGQKQLCILARTLVTKSKLLLLDEPESALDFRCRYQMFETVRRFIQAENLCAVVTLHDPTLALNYCDELLIMENSCSIGTICPGTDPVKDMEPLLSRIYGPISLQICHDRKERPQLIMLKEQEDSL